MTEIKMIPKTVRLPEYLVDQIEVAAKLSRRSFTKQVEVMLENSIDQTVENDLELLRKMGAKQSQTSEN